MNEHEIRTDERGKAVYCVEHYIQAFEAKAESSKGEQSMRYYTAVEALVHLKNHLMKQNDNVGYAKTKGECAALFCYNKTRRLCLPGDCNCPCHGGEE